MNRHPERSEGSRIASEHGFEPSADGQPGVLERSRAPEHMAADKVRCEACPVLCQISRGKLGACDRYGNVDGVLTRTDMLQLVARPGADLVAWQAAQGGQWDGSLLGGDAPVFVTGNGATTTYPDYKPAPFIVSSQHAGIDLVTCVTEGIFSYCSFKVKIDTDRYLGPEQATVRHRGEAVGHVSTIEYGSQFLSLGGVHHLTGGSKKEGRVACEMMLALGNHEAVELDIEGGAAVVVGAGRAPIVDGVEEEAHARRLRLGGDRHLRAAVVRPCRRGGGGRRSHHRRALRAPGRQVPRPAAHGDRAARPQVDAGALLPGRQPGRGLGRHRHHRSARHRRGLRRHPRCTARPAPADGLDHRRRRRLVRARRAARAAAGRDAGGRWPRWSSASARTASLRCARCSMSPVPAARCAPA